jgi:hypothetical protein
MKAIQRPILFTLLLGAIACASCQKSHERPSRADLPALEPYSNEEKGFALFKPKDWDVGTQEYPNGYTVTVAAPSGDTMVSMSFLTTTDRRNDSVNFAALTLQNVRNQFPDLELAWSRSTRDRAKTVIEAQYTNSSGVRIKGRCYFLMNFPEARFIVCEAPATGFDGVQPLLLSIVSNFSPLNRQYAGTSGGSSRRTAPPPPQMMAYRLADGSSSLRAPAGWSLTGAKGACICVSPDQTAGFAFSTTDFWGPSTMPYFDNSNIPGLHYPYMRPMDALAIVMQQLGNSNIRTLQHEENGALAQEAMMRTGRQSDAESAVLAFTSGRGVPSKGFFESIGSRPQPSGQWGILFYGFWASDAEFDDLRPVLEEVAASYAIDEQFASNYIQRGLANLRRMMGETNRRMAETAEAARQSNLGTFEEKMRSGDFIDYKRATMIRGEQDWISEAEGGTLYRSDHWGLSREGERFLEGEPYNYYNFNGSSPVFNENLVPVDASREVYQRVFGQ